MNETTRIVLEKYFGELGINFDDRFLRITHNRQRNTARSTAYVLNEGVIDSTLCFSLARFRRQRTVWITPNGWRTISQACSKLFLAECKVFGDEMRFRFALLEVNETTRKIEEIYANWHANIQSAFASLVPSMAPAAAANLAKISKEILLAVHCDLVQRKIFDWWRTMNKQMTPEELVIANKYEFNADVLAPPKKAKSSSMAAATAAEEEEDDFEQYDDQGDEEEDEEEEVDHSLPPPALFMSGPSNSLLNPTEIGEIFSMANGQPVSSAAVYDLLYFLEASAGVNVSYVMRFLSMVESMSEEVWIKLHENGDNLQEIYSELMAREGTKSTVDESCSLHERAVIYIFSRLQQICPDASQLTRMGSANEFWRQITQLPSSSVIENMKLF